MRGPSQNAKCALLLLHLSLWPNLIERFKEEEGKKPSHAHRRVVSCRIGDDVRTSKMRITNFPQVIASVVDDLLLLLLLLLL